jgi:putative glutamine amidotransferase
MITIGITQRSLPPNQFGECRYALDVRWFEFLSRCGLVGVPLPNRPDIAVSTTTALRLRGLILSGGEDLVAYGGQNPQRDHTELRLLDWALRQRIPVLGVCRGMQVLLHVFGGRLDHVTGHAGTRHDVLVAGRVRNVNSFHRLAASTVPAPLEITASCGGVVEGVRHPDAAVVGHMWHPEREPTFVTEDILTVSQLFGSKPCSP